MRAALWLLLALAAGAAGAAEIESVAVAHPGQRYTVDMQVRLAVSARAAYRVMTDFKRLPAVNPNLEVSEVRPDGRLHTIVAMCVAFLCKKVEQLQTVLAQPDTRLVMDVIPAHSDLRFGHAEWRFDSLGPQRSRLHFSAELEPDFWVPPLVGPWIIQNKLEKQAVITSKGIERAARERGY